MDLFLICHEILYEMEREQLLDVFTDELMVSKGQDVRGVGAFMYDDVLLLNKEAKPIVSLMISEQGEMIVPGSTNTYFEQLIEDYGLKKEDFTVTFLEKLHGFGLNTFHTLSVEDTQWSPKRHRWRFAEKFDSVMRGRATWRPSLEGNLSAGWIMASTVFGDRFFMNSEMQLASFVPVGEDPVQLAIFQRMARADPRVMADAHPLQSKFMRKLYRDVPCEYRTTSCRMVVERLFVDEASQTERVTTALTRFRVLFRCHGTADNQLLIHLHKWKAQGLICLNNDSRCEEALEKFKIAALLGLHVYENTTGETALMYLNVVVEMLMWCVVCRLHARMAVDAMHYAQHALFMVLSPGVRESAKWLAIGLGRLMAECYYCRNMRVAAIICQGMCIKVFESLDKAGFSSCIDVNNMLRACKFSHVDESNDMFDKMHKWRALLEQAVPDLPVTDEWRRNIPLFSEVMCVVEQVKLHPTTKFYSQLNDMMYTYAMRKWRVLLGNAGRLFHREHEPARAIDFLSPAFEISKEMQSVPMQLYDVMYIADCMKQGGRVEDACRWYTKFFTLAGGLEKALLTQVLHDKPDWAAAVVLGYAEVCCAMWMDKRMDAEQASRMKSGGYASVKQAMRLVCQLPK